MVDSYWSKRQFAEFLGCTPRAIDKWEAAGKIPAAHRLPNGRKTWPASVVRSSVRPAKPAAEALPTS